MSKVFAGRECEPLDTALAPFDLDLCWKLHELRIEGGQPLNTVGDLLRHPSPPAILLALIKRCASR